MAKFIFVMIKFFWRVNQKICQFLLVGCTIEIKQIFSIDLKVKRQSADVLEGESAFHNFGVH